MGTETCQISGQALLGSRYWMKNHRMDVHGPRATDKKTKDLQARHFVARDVKRHVRGVETKREAKVGYRKTEA